MLRVAGFYGSREALALRIATFSGSGEPAAPRRQSLLAGSHSLPRRPPCENVIEALVETV
jgi:hypothetical protein